MRCRSFVRPVLTAIILIAITGTPGALYIPFVEDFTDTLRMDFLDTTAWWNLSEGEIKLYPYPALALTGGYDTPGNAVDVDVRGGCAYVCDWTGGLIIVDVSNPASPSLKGSYSTPGFAREAVIEGNYAFIADWTAGLTIVDISNPASPTLAANLPTPGNSKDIAVSGNHAYTADHSGGMVAFDISDPTSPAAIDTFPTPGNTLGIAVDGNIAYLTDDSAGLLVIDVTDPSAPVQIGTYDTPGSCSAPFVDGDFLFIADGSNGIVILDIEDPASPGYVGTYNTAGTAYGIHVSGNYAYVGDFANGLVVIDITYPAIPSLVDSYDSPGLSEGVVLAGEHIYLADDSEGLQIVEVRTELEEPVFVASYDFGMTDGRSIGVEGNIAYVLSDYVSLFTFDVSDPANPVYIGGTSTMGYGRAMEIRGNHAYIANDSDGLTVIDISDPSAPSLVGNESLSGYANDVKVSGNYAYVLLGVNGIDVVDISDPSNPSYAGEWDVAGTSIGIAVDGNRAYHIDWVSGITVLDISNPAAPAPLHTFSLPTDPFSIDIEGDYIYVGDSYGTLYVVDVTNPLSLTIIDTVVLGTGDIDRLMVRGGYVFAVEGGDLLHLVDATDPSSLDHVSTYEVDGAVIGMAVSGDLFYATGYGPDMLVLQMLQRQFRLDYNIAASTNIYPHSDIVCGVRLSSEQEAGVTWEVTANDGTDWVSVTSDSTWNIIPVPGNRIKWRSKHTPAEYGINPSCTLLQIEWLHEFPIIASVEDVPNDQGKQVRVTWDPSGYDWAGAAVPVTEYSIYRRVDHGLSMAPGIDGPDRMAKEDDGLPAYPPGDWDYVASVPARCEQSYSVIVPTLADSTISEGMYNSVFFVSAMTGTPSVYYDSYPDSGWSVDDLAPHVPLGLAVAYNAPAGNELVWEECVDEDFQYFRIYRGTSDGFTPGPGNLVHMTTDPLWTDGVEDGWMYHYKISTVDFSGNESEYASASTVTDAGEQALPDATFLSQNYPNPFNPTTTIAYGIKSSGHISLLIYDAAGRLVAELINESRPAGQYASVWNGKAQNGTPAASGVYFYKLETEEFAKTRKMILLR